jgi:uncharacterized membrane protein (DUF2068 family)
MPLPPSQSPRPWHHDKVLVLIAFFKFAHALLFFAIGIGAHRLLHKDIADQLLRFVDHLRYNPEPRLINFILEKVSLLNDPLLRRIGLAAFAYGALVLAEGIGLYLEKAWGEYLTLAITASFLPWEIIEIFRRLTWIRAGLLTINILVFVYLLYLLIGNQRRRLHKKHAQP